MKRYYQYGVVRVVDTLKYDIGGSIPIVHGGYRDSTKKTKWKEITKKRYTYVKSEMKVVN